MIHQLPASLLALKDSLQPTRDPAAEQLLLMTSDFPKLLKSLLESLIQEDGKSNGDFMPLLEACLQGKLFNALIAEALVDRPVGAFQLVVNALAALTKEVVRQPLLANGGFCRAVGDLLEYASAHMEQGTVHHDVLPLLQSVCHTVHRVPGYWSLFIRRNESQDYIPLELSWSHFRLEVGTEGAAVRQCLLHCIQVEDESLVTRFLGSSSVSQLLVFKLSSHFQTLPQIQLMPASSQGLTALSSYTSFLDDICRLCLWPNALKVLVDAFVTYFCEGVLSPRLSHSDMRIRSTCSLYLRDVLSSLHCPHLLLPLLRYLSLADYWVHSIEASDFLLCLRCLQLLYTVMEKGDSVITEQLISEQCESVETALTSDQFRTLFQSWLLPNRSFSYFPLLTPYESNPTSPPSTGETDCSESSSSTGSDADMLPSELLLLLLLKLRRFESNSLLENLLLTVIPK